jgi:hypothetical protein
VQKSGEVWSRKVVSEQKTRRKKVAKRGRKRACLVD